MKDLGQQREDAEAHVERELSMNGHFKELCKYCGTVISQCRCADPSKTVRYGVCASCKEKEKQGVSER